MTLRVLHLVGSPTSAFFDDLSRLYAADCLGAIDDPTRYTPMIGHVAPDGRWRFPASLDATDLDAAPPLSVGEAVDRLLAARVDVAVPQMFCLAGMTHYRALLDVLGIAYLGNPPDVMARGAHTARAKAVVAAAGVPVPAGEVLLPGETPSLAAPFVVKPVDADNSVGVTLVESVDELASVDTALAAAWAHSPGALVETFVPLGREVRCGVVVRDGELVPLPLEEYGLAGRSPIRDADDKIRRGDDGALRLMAKNTPTTWIVPVGDPVTAAVQAAAVTCHRALGCRDYSLFDFRVDPDGRPWFLEAGLYNSFARQSVIPTMARAAGIGLPELFGDAVAAALARRR